MAVPSVPFYLSQACTEFGLATPCNASSIRTAAGLPAAGYLSELAGRSAASHAVSPGKLVNDSGVTLVGFRAAADFYEQPQTPIGSISPTSFIGDIRGFTSSTNSPDKVSLSVKGTAPVGTRVQLTIQGLGSNIQTVTRGGDLNFFCLFDIAGAYNSLLSAFNTGSPVRADLKVV